ncbi:similar to Saccharomyces cerevisiae YER109C FLO8 Transcription factor required for flocculation, diploid filamentous growth, and haploid invasive growth [Maudiozyma saulgeensis]|uniref:Similar to Saccharomyces cerevisiae YER109C FLO8 Transcription factor required for flocculation, diploid filamentous growth, and haploid invasive growth n=1 Tax=Maudiozyma saulgeensis TaxID=1789683 RepID=A0A1X7R4J6_9SACH|nr:similar to Saccharomyces cerevisiae YER109C FLO8 Transcription factor required for flocculation, diploid filamentous growth, and haploid invasive growth [Kazachstania saulgeensis]
MDNRFVSQGSQQSQGQQQIPQGEARSPGMSGNYQQFQSQQQYQISQQMAQRMAQQQQQQQMMAQQQMMTQQQQQQQQPFPQQQQTIPLQQQQIPPNRIPNNGNGMNFSNNERPSTGTNNGQSNTIPAHIEQLQNQKKILNTYIQDFLLKSNLRNSADSFSKEAEMDPKGRLSTNDRDSSTSPEMNNTQFKPLYDTRQGFLYEWWQLFWDLFNIKSNRDGSEIAQIYYQIINSQRQVEQIQRNIAIQAAKTQYIAERRGEYRNETLEPMELAQLLSRQPILTNGMSYPQFTNQSVSNAQYMMQQQQHQGQLNGHVPNSYIQSRTPQSMKPQMHGSATSVNSLNNNESPNTSISSAQQKKQLLQQQQQIQQQQLLLQQQQIAQQRHQSQQPSFNARHSTQPNQYSAQQGYDLSMGTQANAVYGVQLMNNSSNSSNNMEMIQQMGQIDTNQQNSIGSDNNKKSNDTMQKGRKNKNKQDMASLDTNKQSLSNQPTPGYINHYSNDNRTNQMSNEGNNATFVKNTGHTKRKPTSTKEKAKSTRQPAKKKRSTNPNTNNNNTQSGTSVVSTPVESKGTPNFTFADNKNLHSNTPGTMKKIGKRSQSTTQLISGLSNPNSPRTIVGHASTSTEPSMNKKDMLPPNGVSPHVIYSPQYKVMTTQNLSGKNQSFDSNVQEKPQITNNQGQIRRKSTTSLNNKAGLTSSSSTTNNNITWEQSVPASKNVRNAKFSTSEPVTPIYSTTVPASGNSTKQQNSLLSTVDEHAAYDNSQGNNSNKSDNSKIKFEKSQSTTTKNTKKKTQRASKNIKQGDAGHRTNVNMSPMKGDNDPSIGGKISNTEESNEQINEKSNNNKNIDSSNTNNQNNNYNVDDAASNYMFGNDIQDDDMLFMNTIMDNDKDHFGMDMNMNMGMDVDMEINDDDLLVKDLDTEGHQIHSNKTDSDKHSDPSNNMEAEQDFQFNNWS